jgi:hypothetical protein
MRAAARSQGPAAAAVRELKPPTFRSVDSCTSIRAYSDQFVTSGSSLPSCPDRSGAPEGCSSVWLPAWLPGDDPRPSAFQVVSWSVTNCRSPGQFRSAWCLTRAQCSLFWPCPGTRMARRESSSPWCSSSSWYSRERALPGWGFIFSPSATLRVAGQSPWVKVERPAGRTTLARGLWSARPVLADGEWMDLHYLSHTAALVSAWPGPSWSLRPRRRRALYSGCGFPALVQGRSCRVPRRQ